MPDIFGVLKEGCSGLIEGVVKDQDGTAFQPTTLNFSLFDYHSKEIINSHDNDSLTVATYIDSDGNLTYNLLAADNVFTDSTARKELHVARFVITWSGTAKVDFFDVPFELVSRHDVGT